MQTKEEKAAYVKAYYEEHKKEKAAYNKKHSAEHKEETLYTKKKYRGEHKEEIAIKSKNYREKNKEKLSLLQKIYREEHKEEIAIIQKSYYEEHKEIFKRYYEENKKRLSNYKNEYHKNRRKINPAFKILDNLRHRLYHAVKNQGACKSSRTIELIGCSIQELLTHLQNQFVEGMTFENYGSWHIDHIRPCSSFNLINEAEQKECFNYKNLQPLWAADNLIKSDNWEPISSIVS